MNPIETALKKALRKLLNQGAKDGFVVFKVDGSANYYLQFRFQNDRRELYGECVSNRYLDQVHAIGEVGAEILEDAGWTAPSTEGGENYSQVMAIQSSMDIDEVAAQTSMVLMSVFGLEHLSELEIKLHLG